MPSSSELSCHIPGLSPTIWTSPSVMKVFCSSHISYLIIGAVVIITNGTFFFPMHTMYASGTICPQEKKEPLISCNCWTAWRPQLCSSLATPYKHGSSHLNLILKVKILENPSVILASRSLFSGGR